MWSITFIVGIFPAASETFITGQVAGLLKRGIGVKIFSFRRGNPMYASADYKNHNMAALTTYLDFPERWAARSIVAAKSAIRLLFHRPTALFRTLNIFRYGADAWSLKLLCWAGPLAGLESDLVHCHFGPVADAFRILRRIVGLRQPWLTTLYGYDVSQVPQQKGRNIYSNLARECPCFLVMSEDMKQRVVALGFNEEKIIVHPVGISVDACQFRERQDHDDPIVLTTVARLVEKKGIDDLLRALADARARTSRLLRCVIIGDGPLRMPLQDLAREQRVDGIVAWTGFLQQEDMLKRLDAADIYIQPSKTAASGDME